MAIARELDRIAPDPPLYPEDPQVRAAIERIEDFADVGLQHPVRQALWWGLGRNRPALASYAEGARLGVPIGLAVKTAAPLVALSIRFNKANDPNVRAALVALASALSQVDAWIEAGLLGGRNPYVSDFQVAASLRLLMTMDDLRPLIEYRPAGRLALEIAPEYPGRIPAVFPSAWLEPLRAEPNPVA